MARRERPKFPAVQGWLARLSGRLELPPDVVLDLPRVTLIGGLQVHVENHRGVIEYTRRRIRIRMRRGQLVIAGVNLVIASILREEVVIDGRITDVQLPAEGGGISPAGD